MAVGEKNEGDRCGKGKSWELVSSCPLARPTLGKQSIKVGRTAGKVLLSPSVLFAFAKEESVLVFFFSCLFSPYSSILGLEFESSASVETKRRRLRTAAETKRRGRATRMLVRVKDSGGGQE